MEIRRGQIGFNLTESNRSRRISHFNTGCSRHPPWFRRTFARSERRTSGTHERIAFFSTTFDLPSCLASIALSICASRWHFHAVDQRRGRPTTAAAFILGAKEGIRRSRRTGKPACGPFAEGESRRSKVVSRVRVRHRQSTQTAISHVRHANFQ